MYAYSFFSLPKESIVLYRSPQLQFKVVKETYTSRNINNIEDKKNLFSLFKFEFLTMEPLSEIIALDWRHNCNNYISTSSLYTLALKSLSKLYNTTFNSNIAFSQQRWNSWEPLGLASSYQVNVKKAAIMKGFFAALTGTKAKHNSDEKYQCVPCCQYGNKSAKDGLSRTAQGNNYI